MLSKERLVSACHFEIPTFGHLIIPVLNRPAFCISQALERTVCILEEPSHSRFTTALGLSITGSAKIINNDMLSPPSCAILLKRYDTRCLKLINQLSGVVIVIK